MFLNLLLFKEQVVTGDDVSHFTEAIFISNNTNNIFLVPFLTNVNK
jgi:hypothetical protein